ncbi:MAG: hypothetical protein IH804_08770 [Planctomycetes bacterium]|nr:hypothetical protein [Planctomycetota bacterium]
MWCGLRSRWRPPGRDPRRREASRPASRGGAPRRRGPRLLAATGPASLGPRDGPGSLFGAARRSRGTPRIANRLLRRVRDFVTVEAGPEMVVREDRARSALERLDVDEAGFDRLDRALLTILLEKFDGGPVGLETLAAAVGEDKGTIEEVVEPFLIHQGFLDRTPRGRVATRPARVAGRMPARHKDSLA